MMYRIWVAANQVAMDPVFIDLPESRVVEYLDALFILGKKIDRVEGPL